MVAMTMVATSNLFLERDVRHAFEVSYCWPDGIVADCRSGDGELRFGPFGRQGDQCEDRDVAPKGEQAQWWSRSEEHTSELQSLMRISYAVFCLTKKLVPYSQTPYKSTKQQDQTNS